MVFLKKLDCVLAVQKEALTRGYCKEIEGTPDEKEADAGRWRFLEVSSLSLCGSFVYAHVLSQENLRHANNAAQKSKSNRYCVGKNGK